MDASHPIGSHKLQENRISSITWTFLIFAGVFFFVLPLCPLISIRGIYYQLASDHYRLVGGGTRLLQVLLPLTAVWLFICVMLVYFSKSRLQTLVLIFSISVILVVGYFLFLLLADSYRPVASTNFQNKSYHLWQRGGWSVPGLELNRCNLLDFGCTVTDIEGIYGVGGNGKVELIGDPTTNTLAIVVNGATVYTHHPQ